jgi:hypothetical protein
MQRPPRPSSNARQPRAVRLPPTERIDLDRPRPCGDSSALASRATARLETDPGATFTAGNTNAS